MTPPVPTPPVVVQAPAPVLDLVALGALFGMSANGARKALVRGDFGCGYFQIGRKLFVRRDALLAGVEAKETVPAPRPEPPPVPKPAPWAVELLNRGRRRGHRPA